MLLSQILRRNKVKPEDIGACIFSCTSDLTAGFPATGARQMEGFDKVPLLIPACHEVMNPWNAASGCCCS